MRNSSPVEHADGDWDNESNAARKDLTLAMSLGCPRHVTTVHMREVANGARKLAEAEEQALQSAYQAMKSGPGAGKAPFISATTCVAQ
jgi:hypothetical protein